MRLRSIAAGLSAALALGSVSAAHAAATDPSADALAPSPSAPSSFGAAAGQALSSAWKSVNSNWQCAQFARLFSGIDIRGDAWSWWEKATGKYLKGFTPKEGSVLVFRPTGAMRLGHVAVVSQVLTERIIQVTHANWSLIGGKRGQVEKDVTVVDVSAAGDWSQVKVWFDPRGALGTTTYPTYGFVYRALDQLNRVATAVTGD